MLPKFNTPHTLISLLTQRAEEHSGQRAFTFLADGEVEAESLSYEELDRRAREVAAGLQERGLAGERVLLLFPPGLDFVVAFFGSLYAGAVAVPASPPVSRRSLPRLQSLAEDARPAAALTNAASLTRLRALATPLPSWQGVTWLASDGMKARAGDWREPEVSGESLAFLQYTSGSTRTPKGVMVTHGQPPPQRAR